MPSTRFVGSLLARAATPVLGAVTVAFALTSGTRQRYVLLPVIVGSVLTWLALVHSSKPRFALWMRFAAAVQTVVITTLFSVCYVLVIPLFRAIVWFRDPLALRRPRTETSWVTRTATVDAKSMERMG
jgi:hypothetical protein